MLLLLLLQVAKFGHPDPDVRERATATVRAAGADAMPELLSALRSPDGEVRSRAGDLLDELATQDPASLRLTMSHPAQEGLRLRCVLTVANSGTRPVILAPEGLELAGLESRVAPSAAEFVRLLPGARHTFDIEAVTREARRALRPLYRYPSDRERKMDASTSRPRREELALRRPVLGDLIDVVLTPPPDAGVPFHASPQGDFKTYVVPFVHLDAKQTAAILRRLLSGDSTVRVGTDVASRPEPVIHLVRSIVDMTGIDPLEW